MKKINKRKQINKNTSKTTTNTKLRGTMIIIFILFIALILRLAWLQFVDGSSLKESAYRQQTINKIISPSRGTIYDTNGKALAISASVDTVTINPSRIKEENKEKLAKAFTDIFELDYEETLNKLNSDSSVETIASKQEQDKINALEEWMKDNKLYSGINIDADNKRYYPYNNLASHLIGFTGTDNQGLNGIELAWNSLLTGTAGKILASADVYNDEISGETQQYIEAENGSDVYLTIDVNIQNIVEKYLSEAVQKNRSASGSAIIMNPNTGDILAMATYPDYNLNTPFEPNTDSLKSTWDTLSSSEKTSELYKMWRDKNVSDTYEPGSPFKVLTASIALEENITETDIAGDFSCIGYQDINGTKINCWRKENPHGYQTLKQALANSCNPAFMQLGARIGAGTFYKYFKAFGLFNKTNIATSGETIGIFHDENNVGPVELATISFGQRFTITPIQLITAISSIANDGVLVKPRIVKQTVNSDTNVTKSIEPETIRQVISSETAEKTREMMEYVVTNGTGRYGAVEGYSIGGKTGTSEASPGGSNKKNTLSYVAIAPSENPEIVCLVVLYDVENTSAQGGLIAGPIVSSILSEVLPYLGIASDSVDTVSMSGASLITIPDIRNKTASEAQKLLTNLGLNVNLSVNGDKNSTLVKEQVPTAGTTVPSDSYIFLYTEGNDARISVTVPDLTDMTLTKAKNTLKDKKLNYTYTGTGRVKSQSITANTSVEEGTVIELVLE